MISEFRNMNGSLPVSLVFFLHDRPLALATGLSYIGGRGRFLKPSLAISIVEMKCNLLQSLK